MGETADVFERMRELQMEAEYALGAQWAVITWHAGGYWCARELKNEGESLIGRGPTPVAALEDLLAIAKQRQAQKPHEEEWSIEQCIEWLEERGEISTGATLRTAYLWEKESFSDGGRLIAKAHSHFSWTRAYRNLVVEAWKALSEDD